MRAAVQTFCGLAVFAAFLFSCLFALSFWNRLTIYRDRAKYKPAVFVVIDAEYYVGHHNAPEGYWLIGNVNGRRERLVPDVGGDRRPRDANDLLLRYPKGSRLNVLYNPVGTEVIIQSETLRVIQDRPNFWQNQARQRRNLGLFVFVPVPATLALYMTLRYWNRGRQTA